MRFHKHVSVEAQELLSEQLKRYESSIQMTKEEKKELRKWVAAGNSPYENGDYIYDENGWPLDFVRASRFVEEQMEWFNSLTPEEQEQELRDLHNEGTELPFH